MLKILYSLALIAGCSILSSLNRPSTDSSVACFFIDEKGNFLGSLKTTKHSVRVIAKACWDSLHNETNPRPLLNDRFSVLIGQYQRGLPSDAMIEAWKTIKAAGGKQYSPFLKNNSYHHIYFKPEKYIASGVNALPLQPGTELYAPVDGVNVPLNTNSSALSGKVFRVPDNVKILIDKEGSPSIPGITDHVFTLLLNVIFTNTYMQAEIPDEGWLELRDVFNRSDCERADSEFEI